MALPKQFATKIAGASVFGKADRFKDGRGVLIVKNVISKAGQKGDMFIMEFVVESVEAKDGKPANGVGDTIAQALNLTTNQSAAGNAKAFILALIGVDEDPNLAETITEICNEDPKALNYDANGLPEKDPTTGALSFMAVQPARGMRVAFETYHTTTQKGADFLGVNYYHVADDGKTAERRAALGLENKPAGTPAPKF